MQYARTDNFSFDYEPNGIPSVLNKRKSARSHFIRFENRLKSNSQLLASLGTKGNKKKSYGRENCTEIRFLSYLMKCDDFVPKFIGIKIYI